MSAHDAPGSCKGWNFHVYSLGSDKCSICSQTKEQIEAAAKKKPLRLTETKVFKALTALEVLAECDLPNEVRILVDNTHQALYQLEGSDWPVYRR